MCSTDHKKTPKTNPSPRKLLNQGREYKKISKMEMIQQSFLEQLDSNKTGYVTRMVIGLRQYATCMESLLL